jgi:hypothetical protein
MRPFACAALFAAAFVAVSVMDSPGSGRALRSEPHAPEAPLSTDRGADADSATGPAVVPDPAAQGDGARDGALQACGAPECEVCGGAFEDARDEDVADEERESVGQAASQAPSPGDPVPGGARHGAGDP